MGYQKVIVADKAKYDWGIECKDSKDQHVNSCSVLSDEVQEDFINSALYLYKQAQLDLRFTSSQKIK